MRISGMLHLILAAVSAIGAPAPPSAAQYYKEAVSVMNELPEPSFTSATADIAGHGAGVEMACTNGSDSLAVGWGKGLKNEVQFRVQYSSHAGRMVMVDAAGKACRSGLPLFWRSISEWIQRGVFEDATSTQAVPKSPSPPGAIPTIASVTAIAPSAYRVYDMGGAMCADGSAGHALHLIAIADPDAHPLTDVVIDTRTLQFCSMRFRLISSTIAGSGVKGDMLVRLDSIGGHRLVTGAHASLSARVVGISVKQIGLDLRYSKIDFPSSLPDLP